MNTARNILLTFVAATPAMAYADGIDSGGGRSLVGTLLNHASVGAPVATTPTAQGDAKVKLGMIHVLFSDPVDPDTDKNGLPDHWEQKHFPDQEVDAHADPDKDGRSNVLEYLAGTDPHDPASTLRPQGTYSEDGTVFQLPVQTVIGRSYKLLVSADLLTWQHSQILVGDGNVQTFQYDESNPPHGIAKPLKSPSKFFFKIEISVP